MSRATVSLLHIIIGLLLLAVIANAFDFSFNSEIRRFDPVLQRARERLTKMRAIPTQQGPLNDKIESTMEKIHNLIDRYQKSRERAKIYAEFVAGPLWMVNDEQFAQLQVMPYVDCCGCNSTSLAWVFASAIEIKRPSKQSKMIDQDHVALSSTLKNKNKKHPSSQLNEKTSSGGEWKRGHYATNPNKSPPWYIPYIVNMSQLVVILLSQLADWLRMHGYLKVKAARESLKQLHFASLKNDFEALYINNFYRISSDILNRPIAGVPGAMVKIRDRTTNDYGWTHEYTGETTDIINMGSYNYLGFADNQGPCVDEAIAYIDRYGLTGCSPRSECGSRQILFDLEQRLARYLEVEDAVCFTMGFATNSMNIPALVGKGSVILSDELNHASLVLGCRLSGATIKVFKHNNMVDLERKLREVIVDGQPLSHRPYGKVLIVVEGIYSMEGTIVNLPALIELKKKYKAYLFVDEAHSIGALGPRGRGVVDYWNCKATDVDVLMGTLTKSFAGAGGYLAGSKKLVNHIRTLSQGCMYGNAMSPPVIAQVATSLKIMMGLDGTDEGNRRTRQLSDNTRYFRRRLQELGFLIYGHDDSPVVPLMTFFSTKVVCFGRESMRRKLGVVSVSAPATPLTKSRARFCLSSAHTREQLDQALEAIDELGDLLNIRYGSIKRPLRWTVAD